MEFSIHKFINHKDYKKIFENYFFMTALQVFNSLFSILTYPYVIRKLGAEQYGYYVFATALAGYFISFVSFGFTLPSAKTIAQHRDDIDIQSEVISSVITAKLWLVSISVSIFAVLSFCIPALQTHWYLNSICLLQVFMDLLFPSWFFQGIQKMRNITIIQFVFRIISLPLIFILIKSPTDIISYAWLVTLTNLAASSVIFILLLTKENISLHWVTRSKVKSHFKQALPFFFTSIADNLKEQTVRILIGSFFNMRDLAIYDLANKIITIPRLITNNINSSIFPHIARSGQPAQIKKIITYEYILGLVMMLLLALTSKPIILLLGGKNMIDAYPITIILSVTIVSWLVVGAYLNFIFIPKNKYYYVTWNQLTALTSFLIFAMAGILFFSSIISITLALSISGLVEIGFCIIVIKYNRLNI